MVAARGGHDDVMRVLLDAGADIALRNKNGQSALDMAKENGHGDIVELLESAADKNQK